MFLKKELHLVLTMDYSFWGFPWGANALDSMLCLQSNIGFNVGSSLFGS
jgi:hypothetical protein